MQRISKNLVQRSSRRVVALRSLPSLRRSYNSEYTEGEEQQPQRTWITPTAVVLGCIPLIAFGLGAWQVQRLQWKTALIEDLNIKLRQPPMNLPANVDLNALPQFEYRKVLVRGKWDYDHPMLVGPRVRDNVHGYHLVMPLTRPRGSRILVDRGFVTRDQFNAARRGEPNEEVSVVGLLRTQPKKNSFTPDNSPEKGEWFWIDLDTMAAHSGGDSKDVQPILIEEIFEGNSADASGRISRGIPVGRSTDVELRNMHTTYAITWFSLSAATGFMFWQLASKARRRPNLSRGSPFH